jgi:hypothetical protein
MDLRQYYQKVRQIEEKISEAWVIISSLETSDGGKPGILTEVSRSRAAQIVAEGKAQLATPEETEGYRESQRAAIETAERALVAERVQVTVISDSDLRALKSSQKTKSN